MYSKPIQIIVLVYYEKYKLLHMNLTYSICAKFGLRQSDGFKSKHIYMSDKSKNISESDLRFLLYLLHVGWFRMRERLKYTLVIYNWCQ